MGMIEGEVLLSKCRYELKYQIFTDGLGHYVGRVFEIPAIIAQGNSERDIDDKIETAILDYFKVFEEECQRVLEKKEPQHLLKESEIGHFLKNKEIVIEY